MASISVQLSGLVILQTTMSQVRDTAIHGGTPSYRVENIITNLGQLPDYCVFLVKLSTIGDPDKDTLARVCTVPDLQNYVNSRTAAVARGDLYYRSPDWTDFFTDLNQANVTARVYRDRINDLVNNWISYQLGFEAQAPGGTYTFPTADQSALAEVVNTFIAAQAALASAKLTKAAADAAVTAALASYNAAQTYLNNINTVNAAVTLLSPQSTALNTVKSDLTTAVAALGDEPSPMPEDPTGSGGFGTGFWGQLAALLYGVDVGIGQGLGGGAGQSTVVAARNAFTGGVAVLENIDSKIDDALSAAGAYVNATSAVAAASAAVTAASNAVTAANTVYQNSLTAQNAAAASLNQATTNLTLATSAAKAACSGFDPLNPTSILN